MITFTPEQEEVLDFLMDQMGPDGSNAVISGSGGTGKTTVICELVFRLLDAGYSVAVMAMTGKATSVLRAKINEALIEKDMAGKEYRLLIETVAKITKRSRPITTLKNGKTIFSSVWRNPEDFKFDVLIIDELSMVPAYISTWWLKTSARVFGFGDECQLPEVAGTDLSNTLKEFCRDLKIPDAGYCSQYGIQALKQLAKKTLHKVLRSDNEIALLCSDLRDFSLSKTEMVAIMRKWAKKSENIEYTTSMDQMHTSPDWQIICFTNKKCEEINNALNIGQGYPNLKDKILVTDNLPVYRIYNGDTMLFEDFLRSIDEYDIVTKSKGVNWEIRKHFVFVKWQDKLPSVDSPHLIERNFANLQKHFQIQLERITRQRIDNFSKYLTEAGEKLGRAPRILEAYLQELDSLQTGNFSDEDIWVNLIGKISQDDVDLAIGIQDIAIPLPKFQYVNLNPGYAITTHKSQGSEYEKVCYVLERFDKPLLYTGLSRAKKNLQIINLTRVV